MYTNTSEMSTSPNEIGWLVPGALVYAAIPWDHGSDVLTNIPEYQSNYNSRGAYFTGLSPQTSLTVFWNITIQTFPNYTSPLASLARPSPYEDKVAQTAYSEILSRMPVGVKVKENGLGDWFTGSVASIIDTMTGTPIASKLDQMQKNFFSKGDSQKIQKLEERIEELERVNTELIGELRWRSGSQVPNNPTIATRNFKVKNNSRNIKQSTQTTPRNDLTKQTNQTMKKQYQRTNNQKRPVKSSGNSGW
jgi:hypothetical protein